MWILWTICALLLLIAVVSLIRPLFKRLSDAQMAESQKHAERRKALNVELYEQKKAQIEEDFNNGLLSEEDRLQAQNEIEHSLIHDAEAAHFQPVSQISQSGARNLAILMLIFIPVFSLLTYAYIKPENFDQVVLNQPAPASPHAQNAPDLDAMISSLEKKLEANPDNLEGWNMLGRSYLVMNRFEDAARVYEKLIELSQKKNTQVPDLRINYVQALMQIGKKEYYQKADKVLTELLAEDPNNADALWFMGYVDYEKGDIEKAEQRWSRLLKLVPPNTEQATIVMTVLARVRGELPEGHPATTAEQQAVVSEQPPVQETEAKGPAPGQQMTGSAEEQAFIASMVARVENRVKENPDDLTGWKALGKSYSVLGRHVDSANAYAKAIALDDSDVDVMINYTNSVLQTGQLDQLDKARIVFAQMLDKNINNADALFLAGTLARAAGDKAEARQLWETLLPMLSEGTPAYLNVKNNLNSL
jgi:cytochrome c-type biogenesis protein CcmH